MKFEVFTGVVLIDKKQRIYLIKERDKHLIGQGRWNLPGGSVDKGETIIEAAEREVLEETGYRSKIKSLLACYQGIKNKKPWIFIVLEARTENSKPIEKKDDAAEKERWFNKQEFFQMSDSLMVHSDMKEVYQAVIEKRGLMAKVIRFS